MTLPYTLLDTSLFTKGMSSAGEYLLNFKISFYWYLYVYVSLKSSLK